ncbi:D-glucuronyl C5-epimerase family protein [Actinoplanes sp. NPDC089786]|uniref:D-glucuronyl C5-epimerase family protein n=1 Tax=Actinoplanes sp. NPDC089786 TaxID=3155185 RepID=UPI0034128F1F
MRPIVVLLTVLSTLIFPGRAEAATTFGPREAGVNAWPYHDGGQLPKKYTGVVDNQGVRMFVHPGITGGRKMNHPVAQAQYGLALVNNYRRTHDSWYLDLAQRQARRLADTHVDARGAWYFPYRFDFPLSSGIGLTMRAPWYSAMAQGQATSLFIRLAKATGSAEWRRAADRAFRSLQLGYAAGVPWATHRDAAGRLWLEEYPGPNPATSARVLNGHIFAIYGVWDYWNVTRSPAAAAIFSEATRTVYTYLLRGFRNPSWASSYSLRGDVPSEKYHNIHVNQLLHLHALSGQPVFAAMAEILHGDFTMARVTATIRFSGGTHVGVAFRSTTDGRVRARRGLTLGRASSAPVDQRRRIGGQPGFWYHVTKGALAGFWVQEFPGRRSTTGPIATFPYLTRRTAVLAKGSHLVYRASGPSVARVSATSEAGIVRLGWVDGRRAVLVSAGSLRGLWLVVTPRTTFRIAEGDDHDEVICGVSCERVAPLG